MKRVILVGSPRTHGRSAHLAEQLFEALIEDCPEDELYLIPISEIDVAPCIYCNGCQEKCEVITKDEDGNELSTMKHRCVFDDDMQAVYDVLDEADEAIVVCPVFFSGAPAAFKSLLDRLQPYYWAKARLGEKRPATLHIIGEGGDPHGYGALVSEVRSALAVAGFKLVRVLDWVGKIDVNGEIMAEAEEHLLDGPAFFAGSINELPTMKGELAGTWNVAEDAHGISPSTERPKLDLSRGLKAPVRENVPPIKDMNLAESLGKAGKGAAKSNSAKAAGPKGAGSKGATAKKTNKASSSAAKAKAGKPSKKSNSKGKTAFTQGSTRG